MSLTPISNLTSGNSYNPLGGQTTAHLREEPPRNRIFDSSRKKSEPTFTPIEEETPISPFKYTKIILSTVGIGGLIYKIHQENPENPFGGAFNADLLPSALEGVVNKVIRKLINSGYINQSVQR